MKTPPIAKTDELERAQALLKRTRKKLLELPPEWANWVVQSLAAWSAERMEWLGEDK